jgi:hypothetical protein
LIKNKLKRQPFGMIKFPCPVLAVYTAISTANSTVTQIPRSFLMTQVWNFIANLLEGHISIKEMEKLAGNTYGE